MALGILLEQAHILFPWSAPLTIDIGFGQNTKMFVGQENVNIVLSDSGIILDD